MQNVSRRGFLRSLVSAPAAVVAAGGGAAFIAAAFKRPRMYIVGERGPELLIPNASGIVIDQDSIKRPDVEITLEVTPSGKIVARVEERDNGQEPEPKG